MNKYSYDKIFILIDMKDPSEMFLREIGSGCKFRMLKSLLNAKLSVNELAEASGLSQSHVSHNLKSLLACRFVEMVPKGKVHEYRLSKEIAPCIRGISNYIEKYGDFLNKCGGIKMV